MVLRAKYLPLVYGVLIILFDLDAVAQIPSNPLPSDKKADQTQEIHTLGSGFQLVETEKASLIFSFLTSVRYLNQHGLKNTYTFSDGQTIDLDRRNDLQCQKVFLYFRGFIASPRFRYLLYVWTSNTSQGLGAQVVVAGNLQYKINDYLDVGVGIGGLPTSRAMLGQFPQWLTQDARVMSEEFFRGSFTTGIWAQGKLANNLFYKAMLGNNLSQLGIDAGQLDDGFDTFSGSLWWTTGGFGRIAPFGDYERHENLATTLGASYSRSNETPQSQPGTEDPENSQIRFSDGRRLFDRGTVAPDVLVTEARYQMSSANFGLKYNGFSLSTEFYHRWIDVLEASGDIPEAGFRDYGWYLKGSSMLVDKALMLYGYGSKIHGESGDPWNVGIGLNYYPLKQKFFRINTEYIYVENSPVGYLSYPLLVGSNGSVFVTTLELFF